MPRQKKYNEDEVIEKAMHLFWRYGYETTSTRMLEKAMGINHFSIYSSFGNKQGVLLESIKCYRKKIRAILNKLIHAPKGVDGIKQYFYDVIEFAKENEVNKGCLLSNTINELGKEADSKVIEEIKEHTLFLRNLFIEKLKPDMNKSTETIERYANYLIVAISGLSSVSKAYNKKYLTDYIETVFEKI